MDSKLISNRCDVEGNAPSVVNRHNVWIIHLFRGSEKSNSNKRVIFSTRDILILCENTKALSAVGCMLHTKCGSVAKPCRL